MAGSGWRDFVTGEVVTEAIVQGYLQDQATLYFATAAARDSAIASPWEGARAYLADTDTFVFYNGTSWLPDSFQTLRKNSTGTVYQRKRLNLIEGTNITLTVADDSGNDEVDVTIAGSVSGTTTVVKTADESVTSSAVLQNDDELLAPLAANTDYAFTALILVVSAATPDFQLAFTVPAAASLAWMEIDTLGAALATSTTTVQTASGTGVTLAVSGAAQQWVSVSGSVRNGANSGNLTLQWAQGTSSGTSTTVKAGSTLVVTEE